MIFFLSESTGLDRDLHCAGQRTVVASQTTWGTESSLIKRLPRLIKRLRQRRWPRRPAHQPAESSPQSWLAGAVTGTTGSRTSSRRSGGWSAGLCVLIPPSGTRLLPPSATRWRAPGQLCHGWRRDHDRQRVGRREPRRHRLARIHRTAPSRKAKVRHRASPAKQSLAAAEAEQPGRPGRGGRPRAFRTGAGSDHTEWPLTRAEPSQDARRCATVLIGTAAPARCSSDRTVWKGPTTPLDSRWASWT